MALPRATVRSRSNGRELSDLIPLFEFSTIVNSSLDLDFILNTVLRTLMGKMLVSKGLVLLRRGDDLFDLITAKGIDVPVPFKQLAVIRPPRTVKGVRELNKGPLAELARATALQLVIPISSHGAVVGFIGLGPRLSKKPYSLVEKRLLHSLVDLSGAAIEKALIIDQVRDANRKLDRKIQELNTLFDLSKEFNIGLDQDRVVRLLTFALLGQIGAKQYAICLRENDQPVIVASRLTSSSDLSDALDPLCSLTRTMAVREMFRQRPTRLIAAKLMQSGFEAVVPMRLQSVSKGVILLGERLRGGTYSAEDFEFLFSLGNLAITSIENARLFKEGIERQKLEDELLIAREIQQGLLPDALPVMSAIDAAAVNVPSKAVGGDYYDMMTRRDASVVLAIGDVSGKGTPAALLMASVQAALRALAPDCHSLPETTGRINDLTFGNTKGGGRFITFFWGVLSQDGRTLQYVNAGHNPPILLRANGTIERLDEGGLLLGVFSTTSPYRDATVTLGEGDVLLLFTDGVSEAMNEKAEEFGEEQLIETLIRSSKRTASEILAEIRSAVLKHTGEEPQSDDLTMLVLKKRIGSEPR